MKQTECRISVPHPDVPSIRNGIRTHGANDVGSHTGSKPWTAPVNKTAAVNVMTSGCYRCLTPLESVPGNRSAQDPVNSMEPSDVLLSDKIKEPAPPYLVEEAGIAIDRQPDEEGLAHDVIFRYETPEARVE